MKLQSKDGAMVVDYYPTKNMKGVESKEWFLKILTFMGETQSKDMVNRIEMDIQVNERLDLGYNVIGFNTIPQFVNPF